MIKKTNLYFPNKNNFLVFQCDEKKIDQSLNVLRAIRLLYSSWRQVSQLCILRCFQKAGFKNELTNIDDSESGSDDDELPLSCLVNIRNTLGEIGVTLEEVVAVDNNVVVTESRSDDDNIVNSLLNKDTDGENSESDDDPVLNDVPTNADGLLALDTVRRTLETYDMLMIFFLNT